MMAKAKATTVRERNIQRQADSMKSECRQLEHDGYITFLPPAQGGEPRRLVRER